MAKKTTKPKFAEIVPAFRVKDVKAAIAFYEKKLGFKKEFHWPPKGKTTYAGVSRDGVDIHLSAYDQGPSTGAHAMIFMNGVDAYYTELKKSAKWKSAKKSATAITVCATSASRTPTATSSPLARASSHPSNRQLV